MFWCLSAEKCRVPNINQADGTWVSNRRGRKRKAPEDNWPSVNKQPRWEEYEGEDDETEDEDFGEGEAAESEEVEDEYTVKRGGARAVCLVPFNE